MRYIWLIPVLPAIGAAINGLVGIRYFSRRTAGLVACAMMALALGVSLLAFWQLLALAPEARAFDVVVAQWIPSIPLATSSGAIGSFQVPWGFRLDPLSGMMILVVTGIGTLIHVYSTAYMADEPRGGVARFFCYLNLFCFFMLMLVLGNNFLVMFVGWEGVGLCSYLLIGYWYEKKSASDAGKKAFITNRVGDWGFVLGMFLIYYTFGTLDFRAVQNAAAAMPVETAALRRAVGHLPAALRRRDGQERADSAVRLAAGRDGRPDAGVGAHPRGHDGDRRRLHGRAQRRPVLARAAGDDHRGHRRRADGADGGDHRPRAVRHQARARVLDRVAARLHVHGDGRRRVFSRRLPPDDARVLQGAALPRQRLGDPRHGRRAGHAADGRPAEVPAGHLRDDDARHAGDCGHLAVLRVLQQGRDPVPRVRRQQGHLGTGRRRGVHDGVLHVPPDGDDVLRRLSRSGVGGARTAAGTAHAAHDAHGMARRARCARRRRCADMATARGTGRTNRRRR